jgi:hypothetical protein
MSCCDGSRPVAYAVHDDPAVTRPLRLASRLRVDRANRTPRLTRSGSASGFSIGMGQRHVNHLSSRSVDCAPAPSRISNRCAWTIPVQGQAPSMTPSRNGRRHGPVWAKHRGRHTRRRRRQCAGRKRQDMPESTLEWVRATFDPETVSFKDRRQVAEELAAKRQAPNGRLPRRCATNRSLGPTVTRVSCPRVR